MRPAYPNAAIEGRRRHPSASARSRCEPEVGQRVLAPLEQDRDCRAGSPIPRERIRIVHISVQRTHVHLIVEADGKQALARGLQGFQISAARNVNTMLGAGAHRRRRGRVFADRYHLEVITTPTRARHALSHVLNNFRKHGEDRAGLASTWLVDPFSSGISFPDWKELADSAVMWPIRDGYDPLVVRRPRSWLLRDGWKRAGEISAREVPSRRA